MCGGAHPEDSVCDGGANRPACRRSEAAQLRLAILVQLNVVAHRLALTEEVLVIMNVELEGREPVANLSVGRLRPIANSLVEKHRDSTALMLLRRTQAVRKTVSTEPLSRALSGWVHSAVEGSYLVQLSEVEILALEHGGHQRKRTCTAHAIVRLVLGNDFLGVAGDELAVQPVLTTLCELSR